MNTNNTNTTKVVKRQSKWQRQKAARKDRTKVRCLSQMTILIPDIFTIILLLLNDKEIITLRLVCKAFRDMIDKHNNYFKRVKLFENNGYKIIDRRLVKGGYDKKVYELDNAKLSGFIYGYSLLNEDGHFVMETYINPEIIYNEKGKKSKSSGAFLRYFILINSFRDNSLVRESITPCKSLVYTGLVGIDNIRMADYIKSRDIYKRELIDRVFLYDIRGNTYNFDFTKRSKMVKRWSDYNWDYIEFIEYNEVPKVFKDELSPEQLLSIALDK